MIQPYFDTVETDRMASVVTISLIVTLFVLLSITTIIVLWVKARRRSESTARGFRAVYYDASNIPSFKYVSRKTKRNDVA